MAETKINDLQASDSAFGFRGAKSKSWSFGYETDSEFGSFVLGVKKPNELSDGT